MLSYQMTRSQTALWLAGGAAAERLALAIAEHVLPLIADHDLLVVTDDSTSQFVAEQPGGVA